MLLRVIKDLFKSQAEQEKEALEAVQLFMNERQYQSACELLELLLQRNPDHAVCHWELAQCHYKMGNNAKALVHCEKTRALDPDSAPAFTLLTQLRLPGEDYKEVVSRIITQLKPRTYVEIGTEAKRSVHLAKTAKRTLGIAPDADFSQHNFVAELGDRHIDLAFINEVYPLKKVLQIFTALEQSSNPDSVILLAGCYPLDEQSAQSKPRANNWSGDVWRVIVLLKKYRPDLQIHTIGTAPTGLAVIQNLNPESTFLRDNHDRLVEEFLALDYAYLNDDKAGKLNLFINHWPRIKSMVRPRSR